MRAFLNSFLLLSIVIAPVACGGAPPPPATQPVAPVAPATNAQVIAAPPVDLSPVSEPADTFAVIRWRSAGKTFSSIREMFGVPVPVDDVVDDTLRINASAVALEAPVDALFALDPGGSPNAPPVMGFSVGMRSIDEARQAFEKRKPVTELRPGVYGVNHVKGLSCLLAASVGPSPARLVCADRQERAMALLPYMTRSLPLVQMPDQDLHGELRMAPIQARYGRQMPMYLSGLSSFVSHYIGSGNRKLDTAISDAMSGVSSETMALLNDLDGLSFNVSMNSATRAVDGDLALKVKAKTAWTTQRLFEKATEAGPAPAIFWRAPADSDAVFYARSTDPKHYAGIRQSGGDLLEGLMASVDFPAGERRLARNIFEQLFAAAPVMVSASGHLDPPAPGGDRFEQMRASVISSLGWQLWGLEEPPKRINDWLNDFAALYNRPAVRAWIVKTAGVDKKILPSAKVGPFGKDKGARALEISLAIPAPKTAKAPPPIQYWIVVMPEGQRTWVAAGADKAALEKRLAMVKTGSAESQTIASKSGLDVFKSGRTLTGGFMTIAGFGSAASGGVLGMLESRRRGSGVSEQIAAALKSAPNKGQTPIIFESNAQNGSPSEFVVKVHLTRGTVDDVSAMLSSVGVAGKPRP